MYSTFGAQQITSVTELRQDTNEIVGHAEETGDAILIQRNNEPIAILLSIGAFERYLILEARVSDETPPYGGDEA